MYKQVFSHPYVNIYAIYASVAIWQTEEDSVLPTIGQTPKLSGSFNVYRIECYTVMIFDSYQENVFLRIVAGGCLAR